MSTLPNNRSQIQKNKLSKSILLFFFLLDIAFGFVSQPSMPGDISGDPDHLAQGWSAHGCSRRQGSAGRRKNSDHQRLKFLFLFQSTLDLYSSTYLFN